jgi:thymidylate synthase ThyX
MTEFYWQMDLHNLLHFLELRLEEHAQKEIREYALIIYKIVEMICPISIKHFKEYKFNAMTLGENDIKDLYDLLSSLPSHCFSSLSQDAEKPLISNRIYEMYRKIKDREEILKGPLPEAILL